MNSNVGTTRLSSCGCEIAWLYKDAHRYGINQYKQLIDGMSAGNNVICPEGAVLTTTDPEFKAKMEACPGGLRKCHFTSLYVVIEGNDFSFVIEDVICLHP